MPDLFEARADRPMASDPLADRMRPGTLEEVVGQDHILGPGMLLRRLIEADRVPSLILWGPPGTGKTTLARLIAARTRANFVTLSAVLSGVADLRAAIEDARRRRGERGERTILFVDEIHRWSKSQQDALLPAVERGVVTLIGATTENPSFELNSALLSRAKVFVLEGLKQKAIAAILSRALEDNVHGLGGRQPSIEGRALELIAEGAHGDARRALSTLEVAAENAALIAESGPGTITEQGAEEALQQRTLLYDKAGDEHYGVVSAFIKSMRGSDPDAAIYYLVRMLEAGEDPRFLLRRMVIFASEDVGNADPTALSVTVAALNAFELVGLPEGALPLTQAAAYLARAPKSNAVIKAYGAARKDVRERGALPVPKKLLNASSAMARQRGHGRGYRYPHDFGGTLQGEVYLPDELAGRRYWIEADAPSLGADDALLEQGADDPQGVEPRHSGDRD